MTLSTLNYGNYGIFLIMGSAGFCPSAVVAIIVPMLHSLLAKVSLRGWGFTKSRHIFLVRGSSSGGSLCVERCVYSASKGFETLNPKP